MKTEDLQYITCGNQEATTFLVSFIAYCHLLDDIVDDPSGVTDTRLTTEMLFFLEQVVINPWFKNNAALLWPLIVTSANSWLDANRWAKSDSANIRIASDVLKGQYHEVVWFTAYLCGGIKHQQEVTNKFREYDFEN